MLKQINAQEALRSIIGALLLFLLTAPSFTAYAAPNMEAVQNAYAEGQRIFDEADVFSEEEEAALSARAAEVSADAGFACIVYTSGDSSEFQDAEDMADYLYYEGGFGTGEERSGTLFLIDFDSRSWYVYTKGEATRYLTDSALSHIEEADIGPALSEGAYAMAADAFLTDVGTYAAAGVQAGQYNYNAETGERDAAETAPVRGLSAGEVLIAVLLSAVLAYLPCRAVKKSYAMEKEKRLAQGFSLSYRAEARLHFQQDAAAAKLLDRRVTSIPIPRVRNRTGGGMRGGFGGRSFGGGRSTLGGGRGGFHGGRGGKF